MFHRLPNEVIETELHPKLSLFDLTNLSIVSKSIHGIFRQSSQAHKLIHCVHTSNYTEAEKLIHDDPNLMYIRVMGKTGLQIAFELYDTFMWKIFMRAAIRDDGLLNKFSTQLHQTMDHLDLTPLFNAYDNYHNQWFNYAINQISEAELEKHWYDLGLAQARFLPWCFMRLFCDSSTQWNTKSKFCTNENARPTGECVITKEHKHVLHKLKYTQIGTDFTLVRGWLYYANGKISADKVGFTYACQSFPYTCVEVDSLIFKNLYNIRKSEFLQLKNQDLSVALQKIENEEKIYPCVIL